MLTHTIAIRYAAASKVGQYVSITACNRTESSLHSQLLQLPGRIIVTAMNNGQFLAATWMAAECNDSCVQTSGMAFSETERYLIT
jgi:hypothetical protein